MSTAQFVSILVTLILGFVGFAFTIIAYLTARMDQGFAAINTRFDDMRELWRAELRRVEEVLDARHE